MRRLVLGFGYSAILLIAGAVLGKWAVDHHLRSRIAAWLASPGAAKAEQDSPGTQEENWGTAARLVSNLYLVQNVKVRLAPFETYGEGGALEEVAGNILYASPTGQLGYLSRDHVIRTLEARVPMNTEALRAHPLSRDPRFTMSYFRTLDLLVVPGNDSTFELYASHHRFNDSGCIEFVVSRTGGHVAGDRIEISNTWKDVFVARPCMQTKEIDLLWGGLESGGRLALLDAHTLLVTIGDHQFDGVRSETAAAQDPKVDLGKVVAVDLRSGRPRIYTLGHRNPQGLLVARDGTVWETEHGPQGGDEINLLRDGRNYGWPSVTYGVEYGPRGTPRRNWPLNPEQGRHDGFELPSFVFVPSIGISSLIQPDPREWPLWRDHLLVTSFGGYFRGGGGKLYLVRVERDKRIVYAEEIVVPVEDGERLRDIISLSDGRIAVLSEHGTLLLLRNDEPQQSSVAPREDNFRVTLSDEARDAIAKSVPLKAAAPADAGHQLFESKCASCHSLDGKTKIGPPLNGVIGRRIASVAGFPYSPGMKQAGITWDKWNLKDFLQALDQRFDQSPMPMPRLSSDSALAIAAYLEETH